MDVLTSQDLTKNLVYGNHSSGSNFDKAAWETAVAEVACGRATSFPKEHAGQVSGLRVSPMRIVEESENISIFYEML